MAKEEVSKNNAQWDKLQAARKRAEESPGGTPSTVTGVPARNEDGTFKSTEIVDAERMAAAVAERDRLVAATQAKEAKDAADAAAAAKVKADADAAAAAAAAAAAPEQTPTTVEIEVDGEKLTVAPEIAEAFRKADSIKVDAKAKTDRDTLKAELKAELAAESAAEDEADAVAEAAIKSAEIAAKLPKAPDEQLLISNPAEWQKQQHLYEEARIKAATDQVRAEIAAKEKKSAQVSEQQRLAQAQSALTEQFYAAYPSLKGNEEIVTAVLHEKFTEVLNSGRLKTIKNQAEGDELKAQVFADVVAKATTKIVKIMAAGKKVVPPKAAPPAAPVLVSSAPQKKAPPREETPATTAKFPPGSLSAVMQARRERQAAAK